MFSVLQYLVLFHVACALQTSLKSTTTGKQRKITFKMIADPSQFVDNHTFLEQISSTAAETFTSSLESRIIGTIFGNIAAGLAFKVIADKVIPLFQTKSKVDDKNGTKKIFASSNEKRLESNSEEKPALYTPPSISTSAWAKLLLCIVIDGVSDASFVLPGIGELEDIAWAPISALILKTLFASNAVATAEFIKEILPFTDIIPFASMVWLLENVFVDSPVSKLLNLRQPLTVISKTIQSKDTTVQENKTRDKFEK